MQVVFQEMACDGAKSNVIGQIQFKHVKNCLMFMLCNDWVCSYWTLYVVFIILNEMYVVWCVRCEKRCGKNTF